MSTSTSAPAAAPTPAPGSDHIRSLPGARARALPVGLFIWPALVFLGVVFAYPVLEVFVRSFTDVPEGTGVFGNYVRYFSDPVEMTILRRTFLVAGWCTLICVLVGFPYAYLMTVAGPRVRLLLLAAVLLPFWSNLVVRTYAWVVLLQDTGPVQAALQSFGITGIRLTGNTLGMTIGTTQVLLPFLVLPLYSTLTRIDTRLLDAGRSLGARPTVAFARIYLPLAVPGLLAGATLVFVLSLGFYFTPALLGGTRNSLISQQIFIQVNRLADFGRGGAMALVLLVVTLVLLGLVTLLTRRMTRALGLGGQR
jgi:putative spermidine/putrescine transport system permease protein